VCPASSFIGVFHDDTVSVYTSVPTFIAALNRFFVVNSHYRTVRSGHAENDASNWTNEARLEGQADELNGGQSTPDIAVQIGYSPMSGSNVFMDLQQVIVQIQART
jgi:hypothetical protein